MTILDQLAEHARERVAEAKRKYRLRKSNGKHYPYQKAPLLLKMH